MPPSGRNAKCASGQRAVETEAGMGRAGGRWRDQGMPQPASYGSLEGADLGQWRHEWVRRLCVERKSVVPAGIRVFIAAFLMRAGLV